jgi:hypothetical protein
MNNTIKTFAKLATLAICILTLYGCAAASVAISKKDLDVQTRTSTAIFVDAVARDQRSIFIDVRSGVMEFDRNSFKNFVKEQFALNDNGYVIVDDPDTAQFTMSVYVLNLEKASPTAAQAALGQGYIGGSVVGGAALGAAVSSRSDSFKGAAIGAVAVGAADFISSALVKDVTYMLVADIQIKERTKYGAIVRKDTQVDTKVSDAGTSRQTVSEVSNQKEYRTRIVTTANKANLKLEEAQDLMFQKTAYAMSGFF